MNGFDDIKIKLFIRKKCTACETTLKRVKSVFKKSTRLDNFKNIEVYDIEQNPGLARKHMVFGTPTIVITKSGKIENKISGESSESDIERLIFN